MENSSTILIYEPKTIIKPGKGFIRLKNGKRNIKIPLIQIKDLIIVGYRDINSKLIKSLNESKINLHFLTHNGKFIGSLNFDYGKNVFLRRSQFSKKNDPLIFQNIVKAKIASQNAVIKSFRNKKINSINMTISADANLNECLGIEGNATREYYNKMAKLLKNSDFVFKNRSKHPPKDPLNALLSLGYTLLSCEIHTLCNIYGLDPYIGFYHQDYYGRPSLVCDLMEEWRAPIVDKFIWNLINRNELKINDFKQNNDSSYKLNNKAFKNFLEKWNKWLKEDRYTDKILNIEISRYELLEIQIKTFTKYLIGDLPAYIPYALLN